jgi:hypothetical protein
LHSIGDQLALAIERGIPIAGMCWYPFLDYPGWDDDRYCPTGVFGYADNEGSRASFHPLSMAMQAQQARFASSVATAQMP